MRTIPVNLGTCGQATPELADYQAFNALTSPRVIDIQLFLNSLNTEPVWYSAYATWAAELGTLMMSTMSPSTTTLNAFAGGAYDTTGLYSNAGLYGLARQCALYGQPVIIRLAHEFNGGKDFMYAYGYLNETAAQFVAGWQHIVTYFRAQGATNVLWCWCPNIWDTAGVPAGWICDPTANDGSGSNWYPGDAYVDIIGLDGYMSTQSTDAATPSTLFMGNYTSLTGLTGKPFAICEVGCAEDSRLTALCGGKAGWYELLFAMVAGSMPNCIIVNNWSQVIVPPATNDGDYTINSSGTDPAAQAAFVAGVTAYPFAAQPAAVRPHLLHLGGT